MTSLFVGVVEDRDARGGFEGLGRLEEEATSMLHGSLVLATTLQVQGTRKFYFTSATSQKHRLKACPHVANCPSCRIQANALRSSLPRTH